MKKKDIKKLLVKHWKAVKESAVRNRRVVIVCAGVALVALGLLIRSGLVVKPGANGLVKLAQGQAKTAGGKKVLRPGVRTIDLGRTQGVGFVNRAHGIRVAEVELPKAAPADGLRIVCADFGCVTQVITRKDSARAKKAAAKPAKKFVNGDAVISKDSLPVLENTRIAGNLYVRGLDYVKLPRGIEVGGNLVLQDSMNARFAGEAKIAGNILVRGQSSLAALPNSVKLGGQIVMDKARWTTREFDMFDGGAKVGFVRDERTKRNVARAVQFSF